MTLGLSQITNDADATLNFVAKYGKYFDKIFITVADKTKKQYNILKDRLPEANITYFKWIDDFAAARNFNLEQIDTVYWLWADSDDEIENPERLPEIVKYMAQNDLDLVQLKYDYAQNEQGEAISDHWRERIIKTSYEGKWSTPVHEIIQGPPAHHEKSSWVTIKHNKTKEDVAKSILRNKAILEKHFEKTKDPRDAYYLGMTALGLKDPKTAIQWFLQHVKTSGWDEDQYRSWCRIADSEYILQNFDQALYATDEAIKLKPEFPDAYFIKVLIYTTEERFDKGIEWLKVAMAKPEPHTLSIVDPTLYKWRGMAMGAQCYLFAGRIKEAFNLYKVVMSENPEAFDPHFQKLFEDAYYDSKAIDYLKYLLYYTGANGGQPTKVFESIPLRLFADPRLNAERVKFFPKKKWPEKSIVFFCGQGSEPWGPEYLADGCGGSEEAIIYLSRELAKLGWQVTVFNDREEEYDDNGVIYKPWTLLNPHDEFDVFVAWRAPSFTRGIKARIKAVDLHDTPIGHQQISNADIEATDLYFFKTKFQTGYAPNIPKEKIKIIPNGLQGDHFNEA